MPMMKNPIPDFDVDTDDGTVVVKDDKATQARAAFGSGVAVEDSGTNFRIRHDQDGPQTGLASGSTRGTGPGGL